MASFSSIWQRMVGTTRNTLRRDQARGRLARNLSIESLEQRWAMTVSFTKPTINVAYSVVNSGNSADSANIYEASDNLNVGVPKATITISRAGSNINLNTPLTVNYSIGGSATPNVDYFFSIQSDNPYLEINPITNTSLTFQTGQSSITLAVYPINDVLQDDNETIELTINSDGTGTDYTPGTSIPTIYLKDPPNLTTIFNPTPVTCDCATGTTKTGSMSVDRNTGLVAAEAGGLQYLGDDSTKPVGFFDLQNGIPSDATYATVQLNRTSGNVTGETLTYSISNPTNTTYRFTGIGPSAAGLVTDFYDYGFVVKFFKSDNTQTGSTLNRTIKIPHIDHSQSFGKDWMLPELDSLRVKGNNDVIWVQGTQATVYFDEDASVFKRLTGEKNSADLTKTSTEYTITNSDQSKLKFVPSTIQQSTIYLLAQRIDVQGNVTRYKYDSLDRLTDIFYANGQHKKFVYITGTGATMLDYIEKNGDSSHRTYFGYENQQLTKITFPDPDGSHVSIGHAGAQSSPVVQFIYESNRLVKLIEPEGNTTTATYHPTTGRVQSIAQACGGQVDYKPYLTVGIDAVLPQNSATSPVLGSVTNHRYFRGTPKEDQVLKFASDLLGNTVVEYGVDFESTKTQYFRNAEGLVVKSILPDPDGTNPQSLLGNINYYDYDLNGSMIASQMNANAFNAPSLARQNWVYDTTFQDQVTRHVDELGRITKYTIGSTGNSRGRITQMVEVIGSEDGSTIVDDLETKYIYTSVTKTIAPDIYTVSGLLQESTDPLGNKTFYQYYDGNDSLYKLGALKKVTEGYGVSGFSSTTEYDYDNFGMRTMEKVQLTSGSTYATTSFAYDALDRLIQTTLPDPDGSGLMPSPTIKYAYDKNGNQTRVIDELGNSTWSFYDKRNRLVAQSQPVPGVNFTNTVQDNFTTATNNINFSLTSNGQALSNSQFGPAWKQVLANESGPESTPGDQAWTNGFLYTDSQYATVETAAWTVTGLTQGKHYQIFVNWQKANGNFNQAEYTISSAAGTNAVLNIDQKLPPADYLDGRGFVWESLGAYQPNSSGNLVVTLSDKGSNRVFADAIRVIELGPTTRYDYDCLGNMTKMTDPLGRVTEYDHNDYHRQLITYLPDNDDNPSTTAPATTTHYDNLGRVIRTTNELGKDTLYSYDQLGRQIKVTYPDPDAGLTGVPEQDAPFSQTRYNQAGQVVATIDPNGSAYQAANPTVFGFHLTQFDYDDVGRQTLVIQPPANSLVTPQNVLLDENAATDSNPTPAVTSFSSATGAYESDFKVMNYDSSTAKYIEWTLSGLALNTNYQILVNWQARPTSSRVAHYSIINDTTTSDHYANQQVAPADVMPDGLYSQAWHRLDVVKTVGTSLVVRLYAENADSKSVMFDAIRAVEVGPTSRTFYDKAGNVTQTLDPLGHETVSRYDQKNRQTETMRIGSTGLWTETFVKSGSNYAAHPDYLSIPTTTAPATSFPVTVAGSTAQRWLGALEVPATANVGLKITVTYGKALVYVNDILKIDTNISDTVSLPGLTAGYHALRVEYYNDTASTDGSVNLQWDPDTTSGASYVAIPTGNLHQVQRSVATYDLGNRLTASTDSLGRVTNFEYDALNRQIKVSLPDPDGAGVGNARSETITTYDLAGNVTTTIDPKGNRYYYQYDHLNRLINTIQPPADHLPESATVDNNNNTTAISNGVNAYVQSANWNNNSASAGFEGDHTVHNIATSNDYALWQFGNSVEHDKRYQLLVNWVVLAGNATDAPYTVYGYREANQQWELITTLMIDLTQQVSPNDLVLGPTGNDIWQRLGIFTGYTGYQVKLGMTEHGQVVADAARLLEVGLTTSTSYDAAGQVTESIDQLGRITKFEYYASGATKIVTQPDPDGPSTGVNGSQTKYKYDLAGNLLESTSVLVYSHTVELTTKHFYDNLQRRYKTLDPNDGLSGTTAQGLTKYSYDGNGNLLTLASLTGGTEATNPVYNTTTWTYDRLNRTTKESVTLNSNAKERKWEYDDVGNTKKVTDRLTRVVNYNYDAFDRLTEEIWGSTTRYSWLFDPANELVSVSDSDSHGRDYTFVYDRMGREATKKFKVEELATNHPAHNRRFTSEYDLNSNRLNLRSWNPSNQVVDFTDNAYDHLNRMVSVQSGDNSYRQVKGVFKYNDANQLSQISRSVRVNGTVAFTDLALTNYTYDQSGRIDTLKHTNPAGTTVYAGYDYSWDTANRITGLDFTDFNVSTSPDPRDSEDVTYGYDNSGQLITASRTNQSSRSESYAYDSSGNRGLTTRYNARLGQSTTAYWSDGEHNRINATDDGTHTYDDEGNRTLVTYADGSRVKYEWDQRNRLTAVKFYSTSSDSSLTKHVTYQYDANNQLSYRNINYVGTIPSGHYANEYTAFVWDGQNMATVEQYFEWGHKYVYGPGTDLVLFDITGNSNFSTDPMSSVYALLGDHLNSVRDMLALVNGTATVANHIQYDAFGQIVQTSDSSIQVSIGFTGRYYDYSTGLQYNWHRWYDPSVGKWISEDPIGFAGGDANLSRYVGNASTILVDSQGLEPKGDGSRASINPIPARPNKYKHSDPPQDINKFKPNYFVRGNIEFFIFLDSSISERPKDSESLDPSILPGVKAIGAFFAASDKQQNIKCGNGRGTRTWFQYKNRLSIEYEMAKGEAQASLKADNDWTLDHNSHYPTSLDYRVDYPHVINPNVFDELVMTTKYAVLVGCVCDSNNKQVIGNVPLESFTIELTIRWKADIIAPKIGLGSFRTSVIVVPYKNDDYPKNWAQLAGMEIIQ